MKKEKKKGIKKESQMVFMAGTFFSWTFPIARTSFYSIHLKMRLMLIPRIMQVTVFFKAIHCISWLMVKERDVLMQQSLISIFFIWWDFCLLFLTLLKFLFMGSFPWLYVNNLLILCVSLTLKLLMIAFDSWMSWVLTLLSSEWPLWYILGHDKCTKVHSQHFLSLGLL